MDDSMVERVCEAICRQNGELASYWDAGHKEHVRLLARAAIEAMREPSEQMLVVGSAYTDSDYTQAKACWQAMIANALAQITPPDRLTR